MEVQIFGIRKSPETRKALRFFAERRVKTHFVDLDERAVSRGVSSLRPQTHTHRVALERSAPERARADRRKSALQERDTCGTRRGTLLRRRCPRLAQRSATRQRELRRAAVSAVLRLPMNASQPNDETPRGELVTRTVATKDTNPNGDIFGGWLMAQMDLGSGILASKTARTRVVTVAVDGMSFLEPVRVAIRLPAMPGSSRLAGLR